MKYPNEVQAFTFFLKYRFVDVKDFKRDLTDGNLIKGKYPNGVQVFTFFLNYRFADVKDFKRNLTDGNLIRKCVSRELDVVGFMVSGIS